MHSTSGSTDTVETPRNVIRGFTRSLKCKLTSSQLLEAGRKLAQECQTLDEIDSNKATVVAQFNAQKKEVSARKERLQSIISTGCEVREVECEAVLHSPTRGYKTIVRLDTHEEVDQQPMTQADMQDSFAFEEEHEPNEGQGEEDGQAVEPGTLTVEPDETVSADGDPEWPTPDKDGLYTWDQSRRIDGMREHRLGLSYVQVYVLPTEHGILWGWRYKIGSRKPAEAFLGANPPLDTPTDAVVSACEDALGHLQTVDIPPPDAMVVPKMKTWLQEMIEAQRQLDTEPGDEDADEGQE